MTKIDQIIGALSMDLKRVALAKHNNSKNTADRFWQEVMKRKSTILSLKLPDYLKNLYEKLEKNTDKDNLLMYSIILQNYATRKI
jgi:hypothetical protein